MLDRFVGTRERPVTSRTSQRGILIAREFRGTLENGMASKVSGVDQSCLKGTRGIDLFSGARVLTTFTMEEEEEEETRDGGSAPARARRRRATTITTMMKVLSRKWHSEGFTAQICTYS
jgi:hypothetical protein